MIVLDDIIYSLQRGGGISVYYSNLLSRLKDNAYPFEVICNQHRLLERFRDCSIESTQSSGVFHSSYYRLPTPKNLRVVTTVHDFTYERYVSGFPKLVHSWQKNRAIKCSDLVICVSNNTALDLMKFCKIDEAKIRVVHNGVSDIYRPVDAFSDAVCEKNEVLFVGARSAYKNFTLAVDAISLTKNLTLSIVGGGELTDVELSLLNRKLPNRFKWWGRLTDEQLNERYNFSYALLYPSSYEGFGIPIVEAMRAGCPVVAVCASSIPEVAGDAAILVDMPDAELFSSALASVSLNRDKLRIAGFEQAAKFSWDRCFAETIAVYKELL